jgi:tetratricopeptide (TPR) repeat protein
MTMESKGKIVEAIKAYAKTGEVAERTGKGDKAGEALEKAENFAAVAWGEKKWDAVIEYAEAYLSNRETPDAHFYLASALKEKGQAAKGLEHVDKAIELAGGKDDGKYFFTKAEIHEALGQKDEAINAYKKVTDAKYSGRAKYKVDQLSGSR